MRPGFETIVSKQTNKQKQQKKTSQEKTETISN
jgi:hypothetical protein